MLKVSRMGPCLRVKPSQLIFKRFNTAVSSAPQGPKKAKGIKALVKEYGYSALGIYLGLSCIDLPLCFLMVHSMGQDKILHYENEVKKVFGFGKSEEELARKIQERTAKAEEREQRRISGEDDEDLWTRAKDLLGGPFLTEFAIAYGIHKSLIFIRLPITAAITPGIVGQLRRWGFNIGKDNLRASAAIAKDNIQIGAKKVFDATASSNKFGVRADKKKKWFDWFF